ncbi:MAG: right-handed parallel beta-helix repeat-containing protein [Deltaproteobacteria bacterium]|nr:right-handed parallel beta-helix repeat-containing protein [Deltaproteobacteria bacterium]
MACLVGVVGCGESDDTNPGTTTTTTSDGGSGGAGGGAPPGTGAILPCPPGELELSGGVCQAPGVPVDGCATGFSHDGDGGCVPIRPAAPCGPGQMASLGETSCRAVAPCGSGTWGDIPVGPGTVYVNQGYTGGGNNGSQSQPWTTVQQGINAASSSAVVAVAAGNYAEDLVISQPVTLWGTCPSAVTVGASGGSAGLSITAGGSGAEVHRLAVTGSGDGIWVQGAQVLIDQVHIHDTSYNALAVDLGASAANVTLRRSLVERAQITAITTRGSTVLVEDSVVRDTQPTGSGTYGRAFSLEPAGSQDTRSNVTIRRTAVLNNYENAITVLGSDVTVADSLIDGVVSQPADGRRGQGIGAWSYGATDQRPTVTVTGSVVQNTQFWGIGATDGSLTVERTVVRNVLPEESTQDFGFGMQIYSAALAPTERPTASIVSSLIDTVHQVGLPVVGADATIETTIVRNVAPKASNDDLGRGVSIEVSYDNMEGSTATVRGMRIENTRDIGLFVVGSQTDLDSVHVRGIRSRENDGIFGAGIAYAMEVLMTQLPSSGTATRIVVEDCQAAGFAVAGADVVASDLVVRDTGPQEANQDFGDGVVVSSYLVLIPDPKPTHLELLRGTITDNVRAGMSVFGATASLQDSFFECHPVDLAGEAVEDLPFVIDDLGGNECWCNGVDLGCHALSSGLAPPTPY